MTAFKPILTRHLGQPGSSTIDYYLLNEGYRGARKAVLEMAGAGVIDLVKASGLQGRGGAGFPTGVKWGFIPKDTRKPVYLINNADESEPGTFKDRVIMEGDPHMMLEGMALASYAIGAEIAYLYVRGEYVLSIERLETALDEAYRKGYLGRDILGSGFNLDIHMHLGAGAYICGEETAMLESIEGRRGEPKLKPPFPAVAGLYECPTVINNVETLACLPHIVNRGAEWFRGIGPEQSPGPKLYCLSGHVQKPGVYELPMGISLRELVDDHAGGARPGRKIKAVIPGGVSAPMILESGLDVTMDFESLTAIDTMLGSAGVIVIDDGDCIVRVANRINEFFHEESCGKCTPCREGLGWTGKILHRLEAGEGRQGDLGQLDFLCGSIFGNSFCALGDGAAWALKAAITQFRDEFVQHVEEGRCPFH